MFWFIVKNGTYYGGGNPEYESAWLGARKGAVTFKTEKDAWNRIRELGIEDAQPEEY
jgi:hypothetical protein